MPGAIAIGGIKVTAELIAVVRQGLTTGVQFYKIAKQLREAGYEVPELDDYEKATDELAALPDLSEGDGVR